MVLPKPKGWRWDDDWRHEKLMDWLCTPQSKREPQTRAELAELFGVDARTMRFWQDHPQFREEWERRVRKIIGSPERHQAVLDNLYRAAVDPKNRNHVAAAKLYLEATAALQPKPLPVVIKKPTDLSDAELDELLARGADELHAERAAVSSADSTAGAPEGAPEEDVDDEDEDQDEGEPVTGTHWSTLSDEARAHWLTGSRLEPRSEAPEAPETAVEASETNATH